MKEFENNENQGTAENNEELEKELEGIKDMFQKELDRQSEIAESEEAVKTEAFEGEGQLIQELDETGKGTESEEGEDVRLCECCGEEPCAEEYGEDYPYCEKCRGLMKKYPFRVTGIVALVLSIVLFFGSTYFFVTKYAPDQNFFNIFEGVEYEAKNKQISAMEKYSMYLQGADKKYVSSRAVRSLIEIYTKTGQFAAATELVEQYFSDMRLSLPWNLKYKKLLQENEILVATYKKVDEIAGGIFAGREYDFDKTMKEFEKLEQAKDEKGNKIYHPGFIGLYKAEVMRLHGEDIEKQFEVMTELDKVNKDQTWIHLPYLCALAARIGNYEVCFDAYERLIKDNVENSDAYNAYASYYRFAEKPDGKKILEIAELSEKNAYKYDKGYNLTKAVGYLLLKENKKAFDAMNEFMSNSSYTVNNVNLYAVCAIAAGEDEVYEQAKNILETNGFVLSELAEQYKKGKITIKDVLTDKGGEIG